MTVNDLIKFFKDVPSDYEIGIAFYMDTNEEGEVTSKGLGIKADKVIHDKKNKRIIFPIFFESFLKINNFYCESLKEAKEAKEEFDKNNSN